MTNFEWDEPNKTVKPKFDGFSQVARNPDGLTQLERQLRERAEYCHRHGQTITANILDQAVSAIQRQIEAAWIQERVSALPENRSARHRMTLSEIYSLNGKG